MSDDEGVVAVTAPDAVVAATEAAWDEGQECKHCDGSGRVPGGRRIVHCQGGFMGADWDLDSVVREINEASQVAWVDHWIGHDLAVLDGEGRQWNFAVPRPDGVLPRGDR